MRLEDEEGKSEEEEDVDVQNGPLIPLSDVAGAFLEMTFNKKLENKTRTNTVVGNVSGVDLHYS